MASPNNLKELRDSAWATANGMRVVDDLARDAQTLLIQLDLAQEKGRDPFGESGVGHARDRLAAHIGYTGLEGA